MKRLRPYLKFIAVGALVLTLWLARDLRDLSEVQDVAGISIDPAEEGYLFGLELALTDKEKGFTVTSELLKVQAHSLSEALETAGLQNEFPLVLTHGSLIVLHPDLLSGEMGDIAAMLLADWRGKDRAFITVADGCDAADILSADEGGNLRAGQLSSQILRARSEGKIETLRAPDVCSRYLRGDTLSLPLVATHGKSYRISGSIEIRKAG